MDERSLQDGLVAYIHQGVGDDIDLTDPIMGRAMAVRPARSISSRLRWGLGAGLIFAVLTTAAVLATASLQPPKVGADHTTLAAAERAFGHHVVTLAGDVSARLVAVYARVTELPPGAPPGSSVSGYTVSLDYAYAGSRVAITEKWDPSAGLTIDAIDPGLRKLKAAGGLGQVDIETINGSDYLVGRSSHGPNVQWIGWKTATNVVVAMNIEPGLSQELAFALLTGVR